MKTYSFTEAHRNFATLLDQAAREGGVLIERRNGQTFIIKPYKQVDSPLNVKGLKLNLEREDVLESIQEARSAF